MTSVFLITVKQNQRVVIAMNPSKQCKNVCPNILQYMVEPMKKKKIH